MFEQKRIRWRRAVLRFRSVTFPPTLQASTWLASCATARRWGSGNFLLRFPYSHWHCNSKGGIWSIKNKIHSNKFNKNSHSHILRGHDGESYSQRGLLSLGHYRYHRPLIHRRHRGSWRRQTGTHDVGAAQHEPDGALVDLLLGQEHGVLVEEPQRGHPGPLALPKEQLLPGRGNYHFYVFVAGRGNMGL